jgi:hypothetical protein
LIVRLTCNTGVDEPDSIALICAALRLCTAASRSADRRVASASGGVAIMLPVPWTFVSALRIRVTGDGSSSSSSFSESDKLSSAV